MKNIFRHIISILIISMCCAPLAFAATQAVDENITQMKKSIDARDVNTDTNSAQSLDNKRIETGETSQEKRQNNQ